MASGSHQLRTKAGSVPWPFPSMFILVLLWYESLCISVIPTHPKIRVSDSFKSNQIWFDSLILKGISVYVHLILCSMWFLPFIYFRFLPICVLYLKLGFWNFLFSLLISIAFLSKCLADVFPCLCVRFLHYINPSPLPFETVLESLRKLLKIKVVCSLLFNNLVLHFDSWPAESQGQKFWVLALSLIFITLRASFLSCFI